MPWLILYVHPDKYFSPNIVNTLGITRNKNVANKKCIQVFHSDAARNKEL